MTKLEQIAGEVAEALAVHLLNITDEERLLMIDNEELTAQFQTRITELTPVVIAALEKAVFA